MPAEKQGATTENEVRVASAEEFIEFANRSLEELFLSYVDQIVKERNEKLQQPSPSPSPAKSTSNSPTASATATATATTTTTTTTRTPDVHANRDNLREHLAKHHHPQHNSTPSPPTHSTMAPENSNANSQQPAARMETAAGQPFYEQQRKKLQALLKKRAEIEQKLSQQEEEIYEKETAYLENTPAGNVMTGFDNYTKGTTQAAAAQRRKTGPLEQHRVFSRSSISYNPNAASDSATTPGSSHAPTPVSSSFGGGGLGGASNHPTPLSAGGHRSAGGGAGGGSGSGSSAVAAASKDRKKKGLAGADAGDSESDAKEMKKVRTNFGAARK